MPGPEGGVAPRTVPYTPPMELAWLVCLTRPYWPCSTVSPELVLAFLLRP